MGIQERDYFADKLREIEAGQKRQAPARRVPRWPGVLRVGFSAIALLGLAGWVVRHL